MVPYQRLSFSISTIADSMIPAGAAWGFRLTVTCINGLPSRSPNIDERPVLPGARGAPGGMGGAWSPPSDQTADVAYFRRSRLRKVMAKRFMRTTMTSKSKVVANTIGRAASTLGD